MWARRWPGVRPLYEKCAGFSAYFKVLERPDMNDSDQALVFYYVRESFSPGTTVSVIIVALR